MWKAPPLLSLWPHPVGSPYLVPYRGTDCVRVSARTHSDWRDAFRVPFQRWVATTPHRRPDSHSPLLRTTLRHRFPRTCVHYWITASDQCFRNSRIVQIETDHSFFRSSAWTTCCQMIIVDFSLSFSTSLIYLKDKGPATKALVNKQDLLTLTESLHSQAVVVFLTSHSNL